MHIPQSSMQNNLQNITHYARKKLSKISS